MIVIIIDLIIIGLIFDLFIFCFIFLVAKKNFIKILQIFMTLFLLNLIIFCLIMHE